MSAETKGVLGVLSWLTLLLFAFFINLTLGLLFLFSTACLGLRAALYRPTPKSLSPPQPLPSTAEELLEEARKEVELLDQVRREHGEDLAEQVEERLRQKQAIQRMGVQP